MPDLVLIHKLKLDLVRHAKSLSPLSNINQNCSILELFASQLIYHSTQSLYKHTHKHSLNSDFLLSRLLLRSPLPLSLLVKQVWTKQLDERHFLLIVCSHSVISKVYECCKSYKYKARLVSNLNLHRHPKICLKNFILTKILQSEEIKVEIMYLLIIRGHLRLMSCSVIQSLEPSLYESVTKAFRCANNQPTCFNS